MPASLVASDATSLERPPELGQTALTDQHSEPVEPGGLLAVDDETPTALHAIAATAVAHVIRHESKCLPASGEFEDYLDAYRDAVHTTAEKFASAAGFDVRDTAIWTTLSEGIDFAEHRIADIRDPDSEYNKYAGRRLRPSQKMTAPVRVRLSHSHAYGARRLDRRLSGGAPRARVQTNSCKSSSSSGDSSDPPGEPPGRPGTRQLQSRREIQQFVAERRARLTALVRKGLVA